MNKQLLPGGSGRGLARGGGFVASGIQNIRAPIARPVSPLARFSQGTYIDYFDASDHSADSLIGVTNDDESVLRRVVLKLDRPVHVYNAVPFLILGSWQAQAGVAGWSGQGISIIKHELVAYPITDWHGLDVDTLNWGNQGTLSLASGIAHNGFMVFPDAQGEAPDPPDYISAFSADSHGFGLEFVPAADVTLRGILFNHLLSWENLYELAAGGIRIDFSISNPAFNPVALLNRFE